MYFLIISASSAISYNYYNYLLKVWRKKVELTSTRDCCYVLSSGFVIRITKGIKKILI